MNGSSAFLPSQKEVVNSLVSHNIVHSRQNQANEGLHFSGLSGQRKATVILLCLAMRTRSRAVAQLPPSSPTLEPTANVPRQPPVGPRTLEQGDVATGRPSEAAVSWAVSLLRRRLCGNPDKNDPWVAPIDVARDACSQLKQMLSDTIVHGYNNSALLLGQRGSGKSLILEDVLRDLHSQHPQKFTAVRLNGLLHCEDRLAFKEIAKQLCMEQHLPFSNTASFHDNLCFLTTILRDSASADKAIFFVLDEFDLFAQKSQQCLLYNLLDVMQSTHCQAAIVGLSSRLDADLLLEKRVKSRFSHRLLLLCPPTSDYSKRLLQSALTLPVSPNAPHKEYSTLFNLNTAKVLQEKGVELSLCRFFEADLSLRQIFDLGFRAVAHMDRSVGLISSDDLLAASLALRSRPKIGCLQGLSVLELYLLVSMKRLEGKGRDSYSFDLVFKEYEAVQELHSTSDVYSRQLASRAFEHLLEKELICFGDTRGSPAKEFRAVKLMISSFELEEGLNSIEHCPTVLSQWNAHETFK